MHKIATKIVFESLLPTMEIASLGVAQATVEHWQSFR